MHLALQGKLLMQLPSPASRVPRTLGGAGVLQAGSWPEGAGLDLGILSLHALCCTCMLDGLAAGFRFQEWCSCVLFRVMRDEAGPARGAGCMRTAIWIVSAARSGQP